MKDILKLFAGSAIVSNRNNFKRAVISLTVQFTVAVFAILAIFNLVVYGLFSSELFIGVDDDKQEERLEGFQQEAVERNLVRVLFTADAILLLFTVYAAYILSKRTLAPLEAAYERQARFVADAAHELRTPLAVLQAGAEVTLHKERTEAEYRRFVVDALEEVKRLTALSNNLLTLAGSDKAAKSVFSRIDLSQLCSIQIAAIRDYAAIKNVSLTTRIAEGLHINGKADDIGRLLLNLLKNAIDYNKENAKVQLSLEKNASTVILTIEDWGIGISEKDLPHIFERFYKADLSRKRDFSGTGLGLAIVKEIADTHDVTIEVESLLGKGTVFTLRFALV